MKRLFIAAGILTISTSLTAGGGGHIGGGTVALQNETMMMSVHNGLGEESVPFATLGNAIIVRKADFQKILTSEALRIKEMEFVVQSATDEKASVVNHEGQEAQVVPVEVPE